MQEEPPVLERAPPRLDERVRELHVDPGEYAAERLLEESIANVDEETRASMLANIRLNREITAAAKAAGL